MFYDLIVARVVLHPSYKTAVWMQLDQMQAINVYFPLMGIK